MIEMLTFYLRYGMKKIILIYSLYIYIGMKTKHNGK